MNIPPLRFSLLSYTTAGRSIIISIETPAPTLLNVERLERCTGSSVIAECREPYGTFTIV